MTYSAAVLTVSDGVIAGTRKDDSGSLLAEMLEQSAFVVVEQVVVPDEVDEIMEAIRRLARNARLVVTTGGTGFGPRDVTPEATASVLEREAPGLQVAMLSAGLAKTPMAALSRGRIGSLGTSLVVNLPGSPRGAGENLEAILGLIPHVLDLMAGATEHKGE